MRITTLLENHTNKKHPALQAEHGLSFYIENRGYVVMSDVGQSGKFAENAGALGVDLTRVEALAISHHHYDHGGGLGRFFIENKAAKVYLRFSPDDANYIADVPSQPIRYIGLDRGLLRKNTDRIVTLTENNEVLPGFHLITGIPNEFPKPSGDQRLKVQQGEKKQVDTFEHEMVTVLEGEEGLVVLTGCAHNGVLNMIAATQAALPDKPILAVVGGFHLHHESVNDIRMVGEALLASDIPVVYTGHCTGDNAMDVLAEVLGERLKRLYTGLVMTF
ncbi:MAG: MBL fold metallo-hydrolase [Chloroflexota bacterium]|nr:MBL fold metallo-hydrolase [Chloroflexota bacterium]